MNKATDEELACLLEECGQRNNQAAELLYRKTSSILHGCAYRILQCESLSNEVLQDCFIQIWQSAGSYCVKKGRPLSWMMTIVRNRSIDKLRTERKHYRALSWEQNNLALENLESQEQPELCLLEKQVSASIDGSFQKLSSNQRVSIKLAYFHDYTRQELAEALDTNVNTVKSWVSRGLAHLAKLDGLQCASEYY